MNKDQQKYQNHQGAKICQGQKNDQSR